MEKQPRTTIDGRLYVSNIVETLFEAGGTAYGEYVKTPNTIYFFHGNGTLEGCIIKHKDEYYAFFARAWVVEEGILHQYSLNSTIFDKDRGYLEGRLEASRIWDELAQAKVHTQAYAIKKARTKQTA